MGLDTEVVVVGAGLAGLTAALELQQQGINVVLLEAAPRIGGRVTSMTTKLGSHLDLGGQWIGYGHHRITDLATKAGGTIYKTFSEGLPRIVIYVPKRWRKVTIEAAISKWVPVDTTRQMLRLLATLSSTIELEKCSIYSLCTSIPPSGGLLTMLGTHGGAQDSLVVESMGSIVTMLVRQLDPSKVHTGDPVTSLAQNGTAGVTVTTKSGRKLNAAKIIVTVPPPMLKSITFTPPTPKDRQALEQETQMGVVYKAVAVFERPFWRDSFGGEILMLDNPAIGFFDSSPPSGPGHLCLLITGTPAHQLDGMDADLRQERILSRLAPFLSDEVLHPLEWHEKAWHLDEYCGGGYLAFPLINASEDSLPMPHQPCNDIHWAGTETAEEHPGYLEGAVQSGERAAREVLRALK